MEEKNYEVKEKYIELLHSICMIEKPNYYEYTQSNFSRRFVFDDVGVCY